VYVDGSGYKGKAAVVVVLYKEGKKFKMMKYCLGSLKNHTTYEVEAVGVTLRLELLKKERRVTNAVIKLKNQSVIRSSKHIHLCPAQHTLGHIFESANKIAKPNR